MPSVPFFVAESLGDAARALMSVAEGLRIPANDDSAIGDRPELSAVGVRWTSIDGRLRI